MIMLFTLLISFSLLLSCCASLHSEALLNARSPLVRSPEYQHVNHTIYDHWLYGLIPPDQPHYLPGESRPPGSLLLNMLIKDEAEHLTRTLPQWAKIIDAWIIGVDEHNQDDSIVIIERYLGHIPGHIVILPFIGMGPSWSILVKEGLHSYPHITHGLIADADFMPIQHQINRYELDVRCSKHMFTITNIDRSSSRLMDWIYRNIAYVNVSRRTHQTLNSPKLPDQQVYQTLITLTIEEREGGYGDRSGKKDLRYIMLLEADLIDYPNDDRTLYYLAIAHLNLAFQSTPPSSSSHLNIAIDYFQRRADSEHGNEEERWFAVLKLAEINERYLYHHDQAMIYYRQAMKLDSERADAYFYAGQRLRLNSQPEQALEYLIIAADMAQPQRSLFQWHFLYTCLAKLEYAEAINMITNVKQSQIKHAQQLLHEADCQTETNKQHRKMELIALLKAKRKMMKKKKPGQEAEKSPVSDIGVPIIVDVNVDDHERRATLLNRAIDTHLSLEAWLPLSHTSDEVWREYQQHISHLSAVASSNVRLSCRQYRRTSLPFLRWIAHHENALLDALHINDASHINMEWKRSHENMKEECR